MRKVIDAPASIEQNFADPDVLGVYQLSKKVADERMRVLQFMRFQKTADQVYFGIMEPLYNVYPLTIHHFRDRFADQPWIIYDARRHYGYYYDLKKSAKSHLKTLVLPSCDMASWKMSCWIKTKSFSRRAGKAIFTVYVFNPG